jgi:hypothetical protein
VVLAAIVAVLTAWGGYQVSRWDALSAKERPCFENLGASARGIDAGGTRPSHDIVTFNGWLAAKSAGNAKLVDVFERRFWPEYLVAFTASQKLDPFNNPSAPAGPIFMPEYINSHAIQSAKLSEQATAHFDQGIETRENADSYIKVKVFLATDLLLTALSQRFKTSGPRITVVGIAFVLLIISLYWVPRA